MWNDCPLCKKHLSFVEENETYIYYRCGSETNNWHYRVITNNSFNGSPFICFTEEQCYIEPYYIFRGEYMGGGLFTEIWDLDTKLIGFNFILPYHKFASREKIDKLLLLA